MTPEVKRDEKKSSKNIDESSLKKFLQGFTHVIFPHVLFFSPLVWVIIAATSKLGFYLMVAYLGVLLIDQSHENGGAPQQWFRNCAFFKWHSEYYPMTLVKEQDLDPSRNYMFAYHPHGLIGWGAVNCLTLNANGFDNMFPGIQNRLVTLPFNFYIPFNKELLKRAGIVSCSKKSINNVYKNGPGYSCTVVVGGFAESHLANPGKADLILKNKKGFVKVAIQNGADIIPCFGFGENNSVFIDKPEPWSITYTINYLLKNIFGFQIPFYRGRLPWVEGKGFMFRALPVTVVVGKPISVAKDPNPSIDKIDNLHSQYLEALKDLYDRNKVRYNPEPNLPIPDLNFV